MTCSALKRSIGILGKKDTGGAGFRLMARQRTHFSLLLKSMSRIGKSCVEGGILPVFTMISRGSLQTSPM